MFGLKPLELVLILAVAYLFFDKFKSKAPATTGKAATPVNGTSTNTAPSIIENGSIGVGDTFDLQVEAMTRQLGY
jgi:hypothetical protein